jgi:hypothetical protein
MGSLLGRIMQKIAERVREISVGLQWRKMNTCVLYKTQCPKCVNPGYVMADSVYFNTCPDCWETMAAPLRSLSFSLVEMVGIKPMWDGGYETCCPMCWSPPRNTCSWACVVICEDCMRRHMRILPLVRELPLLEDITRLITALLIEV